MNESKMSEMIKDFDILSEAIEVIGKYSKKDTLEFVVPKSNGADDTDSINEVITRVSRLGGGTVIIPNGNYWIRGHVNNYHQNYLRDVGGIELKDNIHLKMSKETFLNVIPNGERQYVVFRIYNKRNVTITGGNIVGDRYKHENTLGEWGYAVAITGGENHIIKDINTYHFWGDGVNLQAYREIEDGLGKKIHLPTNITIENVRSRSNLRQGMSIECGRYVLVKNCMFELTNGKPPESGVDLEPWDENHLIEYVTFENCVFKNNNGYGLLITRKGTRHIKVINCIFEGNIGEPINIEGQDVTDVLIQGCTFINGKRIRIRSGKNIRISNCFFEGLALQVMDAENVVLENCTVVGTYKDKDKPIVSLGDFNGGNTHNKNIQIINCILQGYMKSKDEIQKNIIAIERCVSLTIRGTAISNGSYGVNFINSVEMIGHVTISDCDFRDIASCNIKNPYLGYIENNRFFGGNFDNLKAPAIDANKNQNNLIVNNTLYRNINKDKFLGELVENFSGVKNNITID